MKSMNIKSKHIVLMGSLLLGGLAWAKGLVDFGKVNATVNVEAGVGILGPNVLWWSNPNCRQYKFSGSGSCSEL